MMKIFLSLGKDDDRVSSGLFFITPHVRKSVTMVLWVCGLAILWHHSFHHDTFLFFPQHHRRLLKTLGYDDVRRYAPRFPRLASPRRSAYLPASCLRVCRPAGLPASAGLPGLAVCSVDRFYHVYNISKNTICCMLLLHHSNRDEDILSKIDILSC
jgi:hypothetical protein